MMKRHSVAIAILLLMIPMLGIISSAATPDNITIDGDLSEWDSDTLIDIDSNSSVPFRMTWNDTHLFFA
ncbi:MAG: hypothetical protein P8Q39_00455, partial [Candidatus Thalassarchaeaceae archaeon]|nr:hypothetical protein [Candidatus Thalassarchaeaceae archaeon]